MLRDRRLFKYIYKYVRVNKKNLNFPLSLPHAVSLVVKGFLGSSSGYGGFHMLKVSTLECMQVANCQFSEEEYIPWAILRFTKRLPERFKDELLYFVSQVYSP